MSHRLIFFRTKDESNGIVFIAHLLIFKQIIKIEIHLTCVRMGKFSNLEINRYKTLEPTMIEEKIKIIRLASYLKPFLASNKSKTIAKSEEEVSHVLDESIFEILFRARFWQTEKLKHIWV